LADAKADGGAFSNDGAEHQYAPQKCFEEGELDPAATIKDFLIVRTEGNKESESATKDEIEESIAARIEIYETMP
jgi:hypothetical protein